MDNNSKNISIVKIYKEANPEKRFEIMLGNFNDFPREVNRAEKKIQFRIKSEKEWARQSIKDGLGTPVQTSSLSDRTANEAISNVLLEEAFKTGNIDKSILKGIEGASEIEEEIKMIRIMRMDFELLEGLMQNLSELDSRIMIKRFVEKKYYKEIACEEHTNYDSVKRRIKALCRMLKEEIIEYLEMNCKDIKL